MLAELRSSVAFPKHDKATLFAAPMKARGPLCRSWWRRKPMTESPLYLPKCVSSSAAGISPMKIRAPGPATLSISFIAASTALSDSKSRNTLLHETLETDPDSNGSACASPTRMRTPGTAARTIDCSSPVGTTPMHSFTRSFAISSRQPSPQPTSRSTSSGEGSNAAKILEFTYFVAATSSPLPETL